MTTDFDPDDLDDRDDLDAEAREHNSDHDAE